MNSDFNYFDNAPFAYSLQKIILKDEKPVDYTFIEVNKQFEVFTGLKSDEIINKKVSDLLRKVSPKANELIRFYGTIAINGESKTFEFFSEFLQKWYKISVYSPQKFYFITIFYDISEEKQKIGDLEELSSSFLQNYNEMKIINEELNVSREIIESTLFEKNELVELLESAKSELETTIKEKDKFFSIIAHDLKSPFAGFIGLTKILAEEFDSLTRDDVNDYSNMLKNSAEDLYKLLENLLEWARIHRGLINFYPGEYDIAHIVDNILQFQKTNAVAKKIEIINKIDKGTILVIDSNMIHTVFRNLISNSLKFSQSGSKIEIGISEFYDDDFKCFYVRDNGIGIPEKLQPLLFEIGEKTSRPGTDGESSTGLGLILCKDYIEKHNGKIWVESNEGVGTTFYFTIDNRIIPVE